MYFVIDLKYSGKKHRLTPIKLKKTEKKLLFDFTFLELTAHCHSHQHFHAKEIS